MSVEDVAKKAVGVAVTASTVLGLVHVVRDDEHGEIQSFTLGPAALFWRDQKGRPRVLGIPFGRWFRGPRK
jgi:hypothetical protein